MKVIKSLEDLTEFRKNRPNSVGFVPTMGALHEGHISLIKQAREENETLIVSIFVNPTQFLEGEDFESYPRKMEADQKICELAKVDALFLPTPDMLYDEDEVLIKAPKRVGYILEGHNRPGHFDGILQVVLKLFNLVRPTHAYFGQKDAQQLYLIKKMVKNLFLPTEIIASPAIREKEGLAMSSRNVYLETHERIRALSISQALKKAASKSLQSQDITTIKDVILDELEVDSIDYIAFVDNDFYEIEVLKPKETRILIAAYVGKVRLIDNILI